MQLRRKAGAAFLIEQVGPDKVDAPRLVVAKVSQTDTGSREATQDPMTGFECQGTPLGRGHIIALFLGGPDIQENYAPQYEQWQQGGAWKRMEEAILAESKSVTGGAKLYMMVRLTYGNNGNSYAKEQLEFASGEILNWTDARIPTEFEVWTFTDSSAAAKQVTAALEGPDAAKALAALGSLPTQPFVRETKKFNVATMPDEDYNFWLKNLIRGWALERANEANDQLSNEIVSRVLAASMVKSKGHTAKTSVSKPVSMTFAKVSRQDQARIEKEARQHLGFGVARSVSAWPLENIDKVAVYIGEKLSHGKTYGIRSADLSSLRDASTAGGTITKALT